MAWVTKTALSSLADVSAASLVSQPTQTRAAVDARVVSGTASAVSAALANNQTVKDAAAAAMSDAAVQAQVRWNKPALTAETEIDTYRTSAHAGSYPIINSTVATALGLPAASRGVLTVEHISGAPRGAAVQRFTDGINATTYARRIGASVDNWGPWVAESFTKTALSGIDLNALTTPGIYRIGAGAASGISNLPPTTILPASQAGFVTVTNVEQPYNTWASQTMEFHGPTPELWWRITAGTAPTWNDWVRLYPAETPDPTPGPAGAVIPMGASHDMRLQAFKDAYPLTNTGGKGCVVFRWDHGLTNFKNLLLPLHQLHNIPAYIAMNSRLWDDVQNSGATTTEARAWITSGLVEFGNHNADHDDHEDPEELFDVIVNGRMELETQLNTVIHGYTVPGVGGTAMAGFGSGTMNQFSNTVAGQLILSNHAVSSGYIGTHHRVMDGVIRQGGRHLGIETRPLQEIKDEIDLAAANGTALTLMGHPRLVNLSGFYTDTLVGEVMAYVAQKVNDGELANISYYQSLHATAA